MVESTQQMKEFSQRMINKISLAPMVRIGTLPFRTLSLKYGADYVFSEEIIDRKFHQCVRVENPDLDTIDYVSIRDYALVLRTKKEEKDKFILQIGTNNAETAVKAIKLLEQDISGVDVNMGCPKKFSTGGGMGSALMKEPENAQRIMKALVENFGQRISVSCKIRQLDTFEKTLEYVLLMQEAGIHWITIHPRTAQEETRVPARWHLIRRIIESGKVKIPVLGSGDMFSAKDVNVFLKHSKANGAILARGAIHYPAIFSLKKQILDRESKDEVYTACTDNTQQNQNDKEENKVNSNQNAKHNSADDQESVEFSQNLVRVFELRYNQQQEQLMDIDIIELVREFFQICIKTGNGFQNMKYNILYILKTHKPYYELFKKLQVAKTYQDFANLLELPNALENITPNLKLHLEGQFYRKNKQIIDNIVAELNKAEATINQSVGEKRKPETNQQFEEQELDQQIKRIKA